MAATGGNERIDNGPGGPFPMRFPIGMAAAVVIGFLLLPMWWKLGLALTPKLQVFYLWTYFGSGLDSLAPNRSGAPAQKQYVAIVDGANLAVEQALEKYPERVHVERIWANPAAFHAWLQKHVYFGSAARVFLLPLAFAILSFGGLILAGGEIDRRRRTSARKGLHVRGTRLVGWRRFNRESLGIRLLPWFSFRDGHLELRRFSKRMPGIAFRIGCLGQYIVIPRELEPYHFNIFGTTGMGKSTLIREMLYQVETRGDVAVLYDPKGEYRNEFYSEERGDIILDPGDERCPYWELEAEAQDEAQATPWAMAFWPDEPHQQPFFKKHPRAIFAYLMSRFNVFNEPGDAATCANLGYWLTHPREEVSRRLKGTEHAVAVDPAAKDQSQGLFTTLGEIAKPLRMMPQTPEGRRKFSVREWSRERRGWIFMTSTPVTVDALLPIHSAVMDMLILTNQAPAPGEKKLPVVWYILDEAATLQKLPQLESGATKQRASGNPIVLGFHDHAQLKKRYGDEGAITIMSQAFTNIVLRSGDPAAAKHVELLIAHEEIERLQENRPVHVLATHRSRSWSNQTADTPVVSAAEIQGLPPFRGYVLHEGKVVKIAVQKLPRRVRTARMERIIPPLIFREPPEEPVTVAEPEHAVAPVDDSVIAPGRMPGLEKKPIARKGANPLLRAKSPEQLSIGAIK
ncbi:MAG: type IV secretion system DNA-binding domain-containing protein [Silvibacterium sp.]|nr:type IV secretion system DNA-binding domain-containing protein [Silvibacterium sp.]